MKAHSHPTWTARFGERTLAVVYYDGAFEAFVDGKMIAAEDSRRVAQSRVEDYLALPETARLEWGRE